mgnify:CR=1 FL=1
MYLSGTCMRVGLNSSYLALNKNLLNRKGKENEKTRVNIAVGSVAVGRNGRLWKQRAKETRRGALWQYIICCFGKS